MNNERERSRIARANQLRQMHLAQLDAVSQPQETDNTKFYRAYEAMQAVDPRLSILADMPEGGGKYVLMAEACNWAAKQAKDEAKALKTSGDKDGAARYDGFSGTLMGASKNSLLPLALRNGAQAQMSKDDAGLPVVLLSHPDAGLIALHQVNTSQLPIETSAMIKENGDLKFTGVRRQPLALLLAESMAKTGKKADLAEAIKRASIDHGFAEKVKQAASKDGVKDTPASTARRLLRTYRQTP